MATESTRLPDDVGVVIVSYRSHELVRDLLARRPWLRSPHLVVVDNSEDQESQQHLRDVLANTPVALLTSPGNVGFGSACNSGVDVLRSLSDAPRIVVLLNPDADIDVGSVEALASHVREHQHDLVAPVILNDHGDTWFAGGSLDLRSGKARHQPGATDWLTGACLAFDLDAFTRIGGFDEGYFLYWEDLDLSYRWQRLLGDLVLLRDAEARHAVGGTQDHSHGKSTTYVYFGCRNRLLFASHHLDRRRRWRWLRGTPRHAVMMWRRGGRTWAAARAALRGSFAGATQLLRPHDR